MTTKTAHTGDDLGGWVVERIGDELLIAATADLPGDEDGELTWLEAQEKLADGFHQQHPDISVAFWKPAGSYDEATGVLAGLTRAGDVILFENDLPDMYAEDNERPAPAPAVA